MNKRASRQGRDSRIDSADRDEREEPGYFAHVRAAIEEGRKQIAAGQGIPADKAWKDLGVE